MRRMLTALAASAVLAPVLAAAPAYADAPSAPTSVSASGGYRSITVSFTAPADDGGEEITGYEVRFSDDAWQPLEVSPVDGSETRRVGVVAGLRDGQYYIPVVRALNADGASEPSQTRIDRPGARTFGPPLRDSLLGIYPHDRSLVVVRDTSAEYDLEPLGNSLRLVIDPERRGLRTRVVRCELLYRCVVPRLRNGLRYRLTITDYNRYVVGDRVVRMYAKPEPTQTFVPWPGPQAPRHLAVTPAKQSAVVTWSFGDFDFHQRVQDVEVSLDGGPWQALPETSYNTGTVTGLEDGRTYALRVRGLAPYSHEPGLPSAPVKVTPGVVS